MLWGLGTTLSAMGELGMGMSEVDAADCKFCCFSSTHSTMYPDNPPASELLHGAEQFRKIPARQCDTAQLLATSTDVGRTTQRAQPSHYVQRATTTE